MTTTTAEPLTSADIRAMHLARMMQTDPDTSDPIKAVRENAWDANTVAKDLADYEHGAELLKRYALKYTDRFTVPELAFRQVPSNAIASARLEAGHIATTVAVRYGYAVPK